MYKVAIAGAGGIGSNLCQILSNFGLQRNQIDFSRYEISVFDSDDFDVGNCLHQVCTLEDVGKKKVEVMEEKFGILPEPRFMTVEDFPNYNLIISCVDSMEFRKSLYEWYETSDKTTKWLDGRCESTGGMILNSSIPYTRLNNFLTDSKERKGCLLQWEKDNKIAHTLPLIVAGYLAQLFLNITRDRVLPSREIFITL